MWHPATHPTSPILPAILALAESLQQTGPEIIAALVIDFQVQGRIRVASADLDLSGFHVPGLVGVMGSAAAASVMLHLTPEQTRMALGISASRAGTVSANLSTMTNSTHCGNAGRMGLEAALLAAKGFTGHPDIFEHPADTWRCFSERASPWRQ
jgi:aconitate decarboxylase